MLGKSFNPCKHSLIDSKPDSKHEGASPRERMYNCEALCQYFAPNAPIMDPKSGTCPMQVPSKRASQH